jgi:hypothetical protein
VSISLATHYLLRTILQCLRQHQALTLRQAQRYALILQFAKPPYLPNARGGIDKDRAFGSVFVISKG